MKIKKPANKSLQILLIVSGVVLFGVSLLFILQTKEMNEIVNSLTEEKTILTEEYQNLMTNYDSLHSDNDTINEMLTMERERVAHLVEELKTVKATNMGKIREYQKELTTLRGVLRTYIVQIDSLNQLNQALTLENQEQRRRYSRIQSSYHELEEKKDELEKKVTIASQLETTNHNAEALLSNSRTTERSSRAAQLKICFTLLKNLTAPVGMKTIFLRIERPDGQLLMHSRDDLFTYDDAKINYSAKRTIEYGGENTDVCIYYDVDAGELTSGEYKADLFTDGFHVGQMTFKLR
jgi:myosin heavy subunit